MTDTSLDFRVTHEDLLFYTGDTRRCWRQSSLGAGGEPRAGHRIAHGDR